jgi:hypothetical protein
MVMRRLKALLMIQPEFLPIVEHLTRICPARFGDKLKAIYLAGSIAVGEALAGVSDLDWFMFINADPTAAEIAWCKDTETAVAPCYPQVNGLHLNLIPLGKLENDISWRFIIQYTTVRLYGDDLLAELEQQGIHTPTPAESQEMAQHRIAGVPDIIEQMLLGQLPAHIFLPLPTEPALANRKLARSFMVIEGGYLLMALGKFRSFRQVEVLSRLAECFPEEKDLIDRTEQILVDTRQVQISPEAYAHKLQRFFAVVNRAFEL